MFREKLLKVKEYGWAKSLIYNLALSLFVGLVLIVILINVLNLRLDQVLSNSMYPTFTDRDIIIVMKQKTYEVGDIIEWESGEANVTHRLIRIDDDGNYIAQGEHDGASEQVVSPSKVRGKVIAIWHNGRDVYKLIHDNYFMLLAIVVGAWVLSITISNELELNKHNILKI